MYSPSYQQSDQLRIHRRPPSIQHKLQVNQPGDRYEEEADAMAARVVNGASRGKSLQRKCKDCDEEEKKKSRIMRKTKDGSGGISENDTFSNGISTSAGSGAFIPADTRNHMENAFSADFSGVRIHASQKDAQLCDSVNAKAFTLGKDIYFNKGEYETGSKNGEQLLAHELTHVVQQTGAVAPKVQRQLFPPVPILVQPKKVSNDPVEVTATDESVETAIPWYNPARYTGPLTGFFRGDVAMTNSTNLADNVIRHLNGRKMSRLNIADHGNAQTLEIGTDELSTAKDVTAFSGPLGRLRGHFAGNAIVHMQNCHAGQNKPVVCELAKTFGVPVFAGTSFHNPLLGFNFGDYVSCDASGSFNANAGRPSTPPNPSPGPMEA